MVRNALSYESVKNLHDVVTILFICLLVHSFEGTTQVNVNFWLFAILIMFLMHEQVPFVTVGFYSRKQNTFSLS